MIEFTVTGIRYQMGEHLSYEERDAAATKFVASLEIGQPVVLKFEPDNPGSPNKAIAVYINYEHIGYISDEQCELVHPLLDERHLGKGQIVRKDNHVTFFITIPGAPERLTTSESQKRILPENPLGDTFMMPITKAERTLELISITLLDMESTQENMPEIIKLTRLYVPMVKTSICREDNLWRDAILKKLQHLLADKKELGMSEEEAEELKGLCKKVRDAVGDMHRSKDHWPERVFVDHLERLRSDTKACLHLFNKYIETFLDGMAFEEADKDKIQDEHHRLCDWLKGMKWSELKSPKNLKAMGYRVNYLGLSRRELYDLYSVLLLIEQLDARLHGEILNPDGGKEMPEQLTTDNAKKVMKKLVDASILTEDWQPIRLSGSERGMVARVVCERLEINEVWQVFGLLWGENPETLRSYFNKALNQKKSLKLQDKLKNILD